MVLLQISHHVCYPQLEWVINLYSFVYHKLEVIFKLIDLIINIIKQDDDTK